MNVKEYIESGILELYATGALSENEMREVEAMAQKHPQVASELDIITSTLEHFATLHAEKPSAHVRENILNNLNSRTAKNSTRTYWLLAATLALLLGSIFLNVFLYTKKQNLETALSSEKRNLALSDSARIALQGRSDTLAKDLAILNLPYGTPVVLKGLKIAPNAASLVVWDTVSKVVYIDPKNLPAPPKGMQYQLWALVGGQPVDAGVFRMKKGMAMQKMKVIEEAQAFAITLEKEGGSPFPTMENLYVLGKVAE